MATALQALRHHLPTRGFEREIAPGVRVHVKGQIMPFIPKLWDGVRVRMSDAWYSVRGKPTPKYRLP